MKISADEFQRAIWRAMAARPDDAALRALNGSMWAQEALRAELAAAGAKRAPGKVA